MFQLPVPTGIITGGNSKNWSHFPYLIIILYIYILYVQIKSNQKFINLYKDPLLDKVKLTIPNFQNQWDILSCITKFAFIDKNNHY